MEDRAAKAARARKQLRRHQEAQRKKLEEAHAEKKPELSLAAGPPPGPRRAQAAPGAAPPYGAPHPDAPAPAEALEPHDGSRALDAPAVHDALPAPKASSPPAPVLTASTPGANPARADASTFRDPAPTHDPNAPSETAESLFGEPPTGALDALALGPTSSAAPVEDVAIAHDSGAAVPAPDDTTEYADHLFGAPTSQLVPDVFAPSASKAASMPRLVDAHDPFAASAMQPERSDVSYGDTDDLFGPTSHTRPAQERRSSPAPAGGAPASDMEPFADDEAYAPQHSATHDDLTPQAETDDLFAPSTQPWYATQEATADIPHDVEPSTSHDTDPYASHDTKGYAPQDAEAYAAHNTDPYRPQEVDLHVPQGNGAYTPQGAEAYAAYDAEGFVPQDAYASYDAEAYDQPETDAYVPPSEAPTKPGTGAPTDELDWLSSEPTAAFGSTQTSYEPPAPEARQDAPETASYETDALFGAPSGTNDAASAYDPFAAPAASSITTGGPAEASSDEPLPAEHETYTSAGDLFGPSGTDWYASTTPQTAEPAEPSNATDADVFAPADWLAESTQTLEPLEEEPEELVQAEQVGEADEAHDAETQLAESVPQATPKAAPEAAAEAAPEAASEAAPEAGPEAATEAAINAARPPSPPVDAFETDRYAPPASASSAAGLFGADESGDTTTHDLYAAQAETEGDSRFTLGDSAFLDEVPRSLTSSYTEQSEGDADKLRTAQRTIVSLESERRKLMDSANDAASRISPLVATVTAAQEALAQAQREKEQLSAQWQREKEQIMAQLAALQARTRSPDTSMRAEVETLRAENRTLRAELQHPATDAGAELQAARAHIRKLEAELTKEAAQTHAAQRRIRELETDEGTLHRRVVSNPVLPSGKVHRRSATAAYVATPRLSTLSEQEPMPLRRRAPTEDVRRPTHMRDEITPEQRHRRRESLQMLRARMDEAEGDATAAPVQRLPSSTLSIVDAPGAVTSAVQDERRGTRSQTRQFSQDALLFCSSCRGDLIIV